MHRRIDALRGRAHGGERPRIQGHEIYAVLELRKSRQHRRAREDKEGNRRPAAALACTHCKQYCESDRSLPAIVASTARVGIIAAGAGAFTCAVYATSHVQAHHETSGAPNGSMMPSRSMASNRRTGG